MSNILFWARRAAATADSRYALVAVALAAVLAVVAGCAAQPAAHARQPAAEESPQAVFEQYQAMARKLKSPRLVARMLLEEARKKQGSGRAIMAGLLALRAGDYRTATDAAALLRQLQPHQPETWSVSLRVALTLGNLDLAREAAGKAYETGGAKAVGMGLDGAIDPWFVYSLVEDLARAHPQDEALRLLLARSALGAGNPNAALTAARESSSFGPGARAAKFIAIQALWGLGRHEQALEEAAETLADHAHDPGLRVFYANMLAREGKRYRAYEVLDDARALAPQEDPQVVFGYAVVAAALGEADKARGKLTALLERGDDSEGAYSLLAQLAEQDGQWGEAFGWYQQIQSPSSLAGSRVASLFALNRWKGNKVALDYLTQLEGNFPGLAPTWAGVRASLLGLDGRNEAAWKSLGQALERFSDVQPLRYQRALLADTLGKADKALAALDRLVKAAPHNPLYLNAYGYTLTEHTDRYREAYGYIKSALAIMPNDSAILDSMGWVLYRLEQPGKALDYLRRAWHETHDIAIARHLVQVYLALNRGDEARKVLNSALGQAPTDPQLLQLKRQLQLAQR
ncbi:MAG: tetratricopeptide repeat protein [Gammaproteobacteria bacterium]|nr:tetratricopeptide repeat protein [Gammaproteobacteria bacterium]